MRADIKEAMSRVENRTAMKGDARHLPEYLEQGETVRELTGAVMKGSTGALALTDRRLLYVFHGLISKKQAAIPLAEIRSVELGRGGSRWTLSVGATESLSVKVDKSDAERFAGAIQVAGPDEVTTSPLPTGGPPLEPVDEAEGTYHVRIPYATSLTIPAVCTACGAPAPAGLSQEITKTYRSVGLEPHGFSTSKRAYKISLPLCAECWSARRQVNEVPGLHMLAYFLSPFVGFGLGFLASGQNWWVGIAVGIVAMFATVGILSYMHDRSLTPAVLEHGRAAIHSAAITEVDEKGHITFEFASGVFAEQFASANRGAMARRAGKKLRYTNLSGAGSRSPSRS